MILATTLNDGLQSSDFLTVFHFDDLGAFGCPSDVVRQLSFDSGYLGR